MGTLHWFALEDTSNSPGLVLNWELEQRRNLGEIAMSRIVVASKFLALSSSPSHLRILKEVFHLSKDGS